MRTTNIILLSALTAFSAAKDVTLQDFPECAMSCFLTATAASDCGLTDQYCQCTTGLEAIQKSAIACLCTSDCMATDLMSALDPNT